MNSSVPPHYTAFRWVLLLVVTLAAIVLLVAFFDSAGVLHFLRLG